MNWRLVLVVSFMLCFWGILVAHCQDKTVVTTEVFPAMVTQSNKAATTVGGIEKKEVQMDESDANKFLLAVEKASHANDNAQAAYQIWSNQPEIKKILEAKQAQDTALQQLAGELMKKAGLDIARYQVDADYNGNPPRPKFVLRPDAKKP